MKRETTVFTRVNIHLFIKLGYTHRFTLGITCHLYKWLDGTRLKKQNGPENFVLMSWVTSKVTSYQATC
jgi:hypothetical protein